MIIHYGNFGLFYSLLIPVIDDKHCKLIPLAFLIISHGITALIMLSSLELYLLQCILTNV